MWELVNDILEDVCLFYAVVITDSETMWSQERSTVYMYNNLTLITGLACLPCLAGGGDVFRSCVGPYIRPSLHSRYVCPEHDA